MEVGSTLPQKMLVVDHVIVRLIPASSGRSHTIRKRRLLNALQTLSV
jgi:hypothetical protein